MPHSSDQLLPLETLRAFDAAARTGSFSAAAERLNLTHGAVSRQIAKLEDWLGLKVFERNARGVTLTNEGNRLHLRTTEAFALISVNSDRWVEPRGTAVVRLASIPSVSGLWLMPRMAALENNPTRLRIVLDVDNRQADASESLISGNLSSRAGSPCPISFASSGEAIGKMCSSKSCTETRPGMRPRPQRTERSMPSSARSAWRLSTSST
ncbi:LysR family transcriptional regulator, partial [Mesorhizobium sp.]|uniref:LysR family transcriptional regulator n=1 Tax=Mesorhizobium sp. TaxID=1871066 RepID=UPI003455633C